MMSELVFLLTNNKQVKPSFKQKGEESSLQHRFTSFSEFDSSQIQLDFEDLRKMFWSYPCMVWFQRLMLPSGLLLQWLRCWSPSDGHGLQMRWITLLLLQLLKSVELSGRFILNLSFLSKKKTSTVQPGQRKLNDSLLIIPWFCEGGSSNISGFQSHSIDLSLNMVRERRPSLCHAHWPHTNELNVGYMSAYATFFYTSGS